MHDEFLLNQCNRQARKAWVSRRGKQADEMASANICDHHLQCYIPLWLAGTHSGMMLLQLYYAVLLDGVTLLTMNDRG